MNNSLDDDSIRRIAAAIENASDTATCGVTLTLHDGTNATELRDALLAVAHQITSVSPDRLRLLKSSEAHASVIGRPALTLANRTQANVHYLAAPVGPEAEPFVEAVEAFLGDARSSSSTAAALEDLPQPARILIFVAAACPHCPHAVRAALQAALASPQVDVTVVDAQWFPELAERYKVKAVPLTVLDDAFSWTGLAAADILAERLKKRGEPEQELLTFRSLIEQGRLDVAAARLRGETGGTLFVRAWSESSTSSRMGLMLAAQRAIEVERASADPMVPALCSLLSTSEDPTLRGDTADLLGQIGHPDARPALQALLEDENPDIREVAGDALDQLEERTG